MATNPMQRQARNSFLLGMILTLIIAAAAIAFLFMQMKKIKEKNDAYQASIKQVYVLAKDVNSGDVLTEDMFIKADAFMSSIPADYAEVSLLLSAYSLYTKDGTPITSEYVTDSSTNKPVQHLYLNGDKNSEVFKDENTGNYYIQRNGSKANIETTEAPVIAKIAAKANTIISSSLIARSNDINTNDVREQEYNMLSLPTDLEDGDYVDVRFMLPNGQDFIVLSKKLVAIPLANGEYSSDIIKLNLSEDEILSMSSAIVEAYRMEASKLYVTKYVEAGLQEAATPTYMVNAEVANLIESNPNIVKEALTALRSRYNADIRNQYINSALSTYGEEDKITEKMQESITSTKEAREEYLQSIGGSASN